MSSEKSNLLEHGYKSDFSNVCGKKLTESRRRWRPVFQPLPCTYLAISYSRRWKWNGGVSSVQPPTSDSTATTPCPQCNPSRAIRLYVRTKHQSHMRRDRRETRASIAVHGIEIRLCHRVEPGPRLSPGGLASHGPSVVAFASASVLTVAS